MDKVTAGQIADEKLAETMKMKPDFIRELMNEDGHGFIMRDGVEYQFRVEAFLDDKKTPDVVTVMVAVDDQGWSAHWPLCRSDYYTLSDG